QHLHGAGQVGVGSGGAVLSGDLASHRGGRVGAQLALQVLKGGDLGVVAVDHQAEGVLSVSDGAGVLLLTLGLGVHAADDDVPAARTQTGHNGIPAVGDLEPSFHAHTGGHFLGYLNLKTGEVAGT